MAGAHARACGRNDKGGGGKWRGRGSSPRAEEATLCGSGFAAAQREPPHSGGGSPQQVSKVKSHMGAGGALSPSSGEPVSPQRDSAALAKAQRRRFTCEGGSQGWTAGPSPFPWTWVPLPRRGHATLCPAWGWGGVFLARRSVVGSGIPAHPRAEKRVSRLCSIFTLP